MKKRVRLWCAQTLKISTVEELEGHRVSIGEEGVRDEAERAADSGGIRSERKLVEEVSLNYTEAAKELENGTIDAFSVQQECRRLQLQSGAADRNPVP